MVVKNYSTLLLFGLATCLVGCNSGAKNVAEVEDEIAPADSHPTEVTVSTASIKPFTYEVHTNGIVVPSQNQSIIFNTDGIIEKIYIHDGMQVNKDAIIAVLSKEQQLLDLEDAQVKLKERQLEYESQLIGVGHHGDSTERNTLKRNLAFVSGLKAAELTYKKAKLAVANTVVKAPAGGVVSNVGVTKGTYVAKGAELCTIYDNNNLWIETEVLESVIDRLAIDQQAEAVPLANYKPYAAKIKQINPWVSKNGTVRVRLEVEDPTGLVPGMHVAITIKVRYHNTVNIPEDALVIRSGKEVVFVYVDGLAKWRYVKTGLKNDKEVEIIEGINVGDTVITANNIYLAHDSPVVIMDETQ